MVKKATVVKDNGSLSRRIRVMVSRQIDYAKVKIEFECAESLPDDADRVKALTGICEELETLADDRISAYDEDYDPNSAPDTGEDTGTEEGTEEGADEGADESQEIELSEDLINSMEQAELVELCETTEGLEDIDTTKKPKLLKMLIIDALFDEEGGEDDNGAEEGAGDDAGADGDDEGAEGQDEWQDDDWQDD